MTNNNPNNLPETEIQPAKVRESKRISPFWLLPIVALCICGILFFQIVKEQGVMIKITFNSGDGLVANKTQIRYQGLQIGVVKKVNFTDDLRQVEVQASIYPEAKTVLRQNTRFWLVQPSASLAGISGLDTLISGNYITIQPGDGGYQDQFIAEQEGPIAQVNEGDLSIRLIADDLGSISTGASVYYKKMPVGKIYDSRFTADKKQVEIQIIIDKAYASLVKKDSHFWNISGINANISPAGLNFNMESLNAIVQGAVTFDSPDNSPIAEQNQSFKLYHNLQDAKRGMEIDVDLPKIAHLEAGKTGVFYQDIQIGLLSQLESDKLNGAPFKGKLLIDPNMAELFKTNTQIVVRSPKVNLGNLANLPTLLRGEYLEILPGEGETKRDFQVVQEKTLLLNDKNNLQLSLIAAETYGIRAQQPIYYNNINIGEIVEQQVDTNGVVFKAVIFSPYRHLVYQDSQFIAAANFDVAIGVDGLRFEAASPDKWLQGGIRMINHKNQGTALSQYPIYKNQENAEAGITANQLSVSTTLSTQELPSINKGSLVLYRQFEVGKVLDIRPTQKNFEIDVGIYPKYLHLLSEKSLFWVESAAQIDITPKGISIQASPLGRSLKGAISFDNSGSARNKTLYANELRAKSAGQIISLSTEDATNLSKGMALRYMGLSVGEIDSISLDRNSGKIVAKALMNPNYMSLVAKEGSQFKIISPQISAGGIENLSSLLQPYIDIDAGSGKYKNQFHLQDPNTPQNNKYSRGFPIILETTNAANLTIGAPVMYRGVDVGKINNMELNSLGDRVLIHILIATKYQHLVRQNSEFWVSSGYSAELGWSGIAVNTGSVQQLLKGGISFSNPSSTVIPPQAKANQRFLLQIKRPDEANKWNTGVMPN